MSFLVERFLDARGRGDAAGLAEVLHDEVTNEVLGDPVAFYPLPRLRTGRDAVVAMHLDFIRFLELIEREFVDMLVDEDGSAAMAILNSRFVNRVTGRSRNLRVSDWLRFKDGRIVEIKQLFDTAALRELIDG